MTTPEQEFPLLTKAMLEAHALQQSKVSTVCEPHLNSRREDLPLILSPKQKAQEKSVAALHGHLRSLLSRIGKTIRLLVYR
jgi:hypothetical protein